VVEDVAGVPAGLDLLQPGVIVLVVQRVPGDPGGIPLRIGEVDIRMVGLCPGGQQPLSGSRSARLSEQPGRFRELDPLAGDLVEE
jgi:hypothetical protein